MAAKDYYAILGLSKNATDKDIKQAYRKLARQYHPDVNPGNKSAEARFKEINEAHEVLSDPEKRKKYDQFGEQWQYADQFARAGGQQQQPAWDFRQKAALNHDFGDMGGAEGFGDIFDSLLRGSRGRTTRRPLRGQDFEQPVEVSLEEAYRGTGGCSRCRWRNHAPPVRVRAAAPAAAQGPCSGPDVSRSRSRRASGKAPASGSPARAVRARWEAKLATFTC